MEYKPSASVESFASPVPIDFLAGVVADPEVARITGMGLDSGGSVSSLFSFDLEDIEAFWNQFYDDKDQSVDASVTSGDSVPDLGKV